MKRKLIQLSPSTKVISIPSPWIKKNNLVKGDNIEIQEIENTLHLSTNSKKTLKKIIIDLKPFEKKMAFTNCDAVYISGYDEITFLIHEKQFEEILKYVAAEVPGMIIVEQLPNKVIFKDITSNHNEDIDSLIRRIINMSISIIQDGYKASSNKDWKTLENLKSKDYILNSYISYTQRLINKFGYNNLSKSGLIITYLKLLEMISDEIAILMKKSSKLKIQTIKEFDTLLEIYQIIRQLNEKYTSEKCIKLNKLNNSFETSSEFITEINTIKSLLYNLIEIKVQLQF